MRLANVWAVRAGLLVVGVAGGALVGCGSSDDGDKSTTGAKPAAAARVLDTKKVARAITISVREQRDVAAKVTCPTTIRQAKGVNFVCRATSKFGNTDFAVVQLDDAGRVSYAAAKTTKKD